MCVHLLYALCVQYSSIPSSFILQPYIHSVSNAKWRKHLLRLLHWVFQEILLLLPMRIINFRYVTWKDNVRMGFQGDFQSGKGPLFVFFPRVSGENPPPLFSLDWALGSLEEEAHLLGWLEERSLHQIGEWRFPPRRLFRNHCTTFCFWAFFGPIKLKSDFAIRYCMI